MEAPAGQGGPSFQGAWEDHDGTPFRIATAGEHCLEGASESLVARLPDGSTAHLSLLADGRSCSLERTAGEACRGRLHAVGSRILWSDGVVWFRRPEVERPDRGPGSEEPDGTVVAAQAAGGGRRGVEEMASAAVGGGSPPSRAAEAAPLGGAEAAGGALLNVAAEAEVVVRHLIKGTELSVVLPRDATFYELKKAVSMRVGREEFLKRARLACKQSGQLLPCQDSSVVGDVREVIVIGASLEVHHDEQALSPGAARLERTAGAPAEGDRRGRPSPR